MKFYDFNTSKTHLIPETIADFVNHDHKHVIVRLYGYSVVQVNDGFGFEQFDGCEWVGRYMPDPVLIEFAEYYMQTGELKEELLDLINPFGFEYRKIGIIKDLEKLINL